MNKPQIWLGAISGVALVVMVAFTLPVGRPISDDYCGYISISPSNLFGFTFDTYRQLMANIVGFGIYEVFTVIGIQTSPHFSLAFYFLTTFALIVALGLALQYLVLYRPDKKISRATVTLSAALASILLISIALPSPTGNLAMLSLMTLTTTTGIFHIWPILIGLTLLIYCLSAPKKSLSLSGFLVVSLLSATNSLLGHAESIAYMGVVGLCWLVVFISAWGDDLLRSNRMNAVFIGALLGLLVTAINPGSKSPFAVLRGDAAGFATAGEGTQRFGSIPEFIVYFASYSQDSVGRNLGSGVLFLAFILAAAIGILFSGRLVAHTTLARAILLISALFFVLLVFIGMGEFFGYPAWYHEVGLYICLVAWIVLVGILVGGVVGEKWVNRSQLAVMGLVGGYAVLLGIGVAAYLSRIEYLQERADRWDAGYFTTIVHPTDGTLILPDGDSGIEWVAQCAKTFADLRGLEFKNY